MMKQQVADIETLYRSRSHFDRCLAIKAIAKLRPPSDRDFQILFGLMRDDVLVVRLNVAQAFLELKAYSFVYKSQVEARMKELYPAVYFGDPHFRDVTTAEGKEYYALNDVLEGME
jgi:hypothetical protein